MWLAWLVAMALPLILTVESQTVMPKLNQPAQCSGPHSCVCSDHNRLHTNFWLTNVVVGGPFKTFMGAA